MYKSLNEQGILSVVELALSLNDEKLNSIAIEIFSHFVEALPTMVREFILSESEPNSRLSVSSTNSNGSLQATPKSSASSTKDDYELGEQTLLNLVIRCLINDPDSELSGAMQITNLLKLLVDPENMLTALNKAEKAEFLSHFYKKSISHLVAPLLRNTQDNVVEKDNYRIAQLQNLILDFLSFCVEHHTYHVKNFIIQKDLLKRILVLLKSKHQFLALSALRFLRKTISIKEEVYHRYIVKSNLFEPVVQALRSNAARYNILNSAIIELFDFIRSDDIKSLLNYVVETFMKDNLENITYVKTFKELKLRYEQSKEKLNDSLSRTMLSNEGTPAIFRTRASSDRFRPEPIDFDRDEDAWIEEDEEEAEANNSNGESKSTPSVQAAQSAGNNSFNDESASTTGDTNLDKFLELKKAKEADKDSEDALIFTPVRSPITNGSKSININIKSTIVNGGNNKHLANILETPSNSPINARKFALVDYGSDSDEDEASQNSSTEAISSSSSNDTSPSVSSSSSSSASVIVNKDNKENESVVAADSSSAIEDAAMDAGDEKSHKKSMHEIKENSNDQITSSSSAGSLSESDKNSVCDTKEDMQTSTTVTSTSSPFVVKSKEVLADNAFNHLKGSGSDDESTVNHHFHCEMDHLSSNTTVEPANKRARLSSS